VKHILLWIALLLFIAWVIVRLAVAVTSVVLNLLWIVALVFFLIWVVKRFASAEADR
jgi:flagellar biogenesis protein FliO